MRAVDHYNRREVSERSLSVPSYDRRAMLTRDYRSLQGEQEFDYKTDRKERRRAEKLAKKQARIASHTQWVETRRRAREEAIARRELKQEQREARKLSVRVSTRRAAQSMPIVTMDVDGSPGRRRSRSAQSKSSLWNPPERHDDETLPPKKKHKKVASNEAVPTRLEVWEEPVLQSCGGGSRLIEDACSALPPRLPLDSQVPPIVRERARRSVNKLTMANVVGLTNEISELFSGVVPGASRANVIQCLSEHIDRLCSMDAGVLTTTGTLPFAGLLRGLQILHGSQVGAALVERVCFALYEHIRQANENAAGNLSMVLGQLYLLYGVDSTLVVTFLRFLLEQGRFVQHVECSPNSGNVASRMALGAASCGLTFLRACGAKMVKEAPAQMEQALLAAKSCVAGISSASGSVRFQALVDVMVDIAAGHIRKGKRSTVEQDAPVEAMLSDLCQLLPERQKLGNSRTLRRIVQTANTVSGITWQQMLLVNKPPRWYVPGELQTMQGGTAAAQDEKEDLVEGSDVSRKVAIDSSMSSNSTSDDEQEVRKASIHRMRLEEKAIAGQRLNTEHKKDIFKCVTSAADDLECFSLLMHRDPSYSRFSDVCAVLLQSCCQEKRFNPYYVQVLERFCSSKNACKKTLQFAIWDRLKSIRIEGVDVAGYLNLACAMTRLMEVGLYTLSLLRGLDLEETNRTIGLFTRILLLRMLLQLPPRRLTEMFFGGDGFSAHDVHTETLAFRASLQKFMGQYFMDEKVASRWLPLFFDVVASGTPFGADPSTTAASEPQNERSLSDEQLLSFMKRVHVAYKALKQGIS